jgi:hypothetical protein
MNPGWGKGVGGAVMCSYHTNISMCGPLPGGFLFHYLTLRALQIRRNVYAPLDGSLDVERTSMVTRKVRVAVQRV